MQRLIAACLRYRFLVLSLTLVLIVLFFPQGVAGLVSERYARIIKRKAA